MAANFTAKRWSKEDVHLLERNLDRYNWDITKLPLLSLAQKFDRTEGAIIAKAKRLIENYKREYEWSETEQTGAFHYYLKGLALKEIHEKLLNFGSQATLDQLESEMKRMRKFHEQEIRTYAEERNLTTAKNFKLDTIEFFVKNRNTQSDFVRKALHTKIKNG